MHAVKTGEEPLMRPEVPRESASALMHSLMKDCWAEDPEYRPGFPYVRKMLREIAGGQ